MIFHGHILFQDANVYTNSLETPIYCWVSTMKSAFYTASHLPNLLFKV